MSPARLQGDLFDESSQVSTFPGVDLSPPILPCLWPFWCGPHPSTHTHCLSTLLVWTSPPPSISCLSASCAQGDLDDEASLSRALSGVDLIYCHALSTDAARADPKELQRAHRLANAAAAARKCVHACGST